MKNEAETCTVLKNSLISQGHYAYKIPDPSSQFGATTQRPFDMFGIIQDKPFYCEVKYLNKLQSFNLERIEDHQIQNLVDIQRRMPNALCWIVLGVKNGRGDSRFYFFKDIFTIEQRRLNKQNFLKKELETLTYFSVRKNIIEGDFINDI